MIGLVLNICAYALLAIIMLFVNIKFEQQLSDARLPHQILVEKLRLSGAILLMIWAMFMGLYMTIDFKHILAGPLNERLNFFETITNFLFPYFVVMMALGDGLVKWFLRKFKKRRK